MRILFSFLFVTAAQAAFIAGPDGMPAGWTTWSARAETAPRCFVDPLHFRTKPGSLAINGLSNIAEHGGWHKLVPGVEQNAWYRFTAYYRTEGVTHDSVQVLARVDWENAANKRVGRPDYVYKTTREGDWTRVTMDAPAPEKAASATLQLYLSNSPQELCGGTTFRLRKSPHPHQDQSSSQRSTCVRKTRRIRR